MLITNELLTEWEACEDGKSKFNELFPEGKNAIEAIQGLIDANCDGCAKWLFMKLRENGLLLEYTEKGYRNSGDRNSGDCNSGDCNSGDWNSGDRNSGDCNSGDWNSGYRNSGDRNSGDWNSGDRNSGDCNSGDWNSGYGNSGYRNSGDRNSGEWNSGYRNSGDRNSGDWNSGYRNSGDRNSGDRNSGYRNSGDRNSGDRNSGDRNSGDRNSGDWNSGHYNSGFLNSNTQNTIRVFNKEILLEAWDKAYKPKFLFFNLVFWVSSKDMTEKEKAENPSHETNAGFLRFLSYKEAFKKSWDEADKTDRERIRDLPNFDAEVFFEISGIDLREPKESQL